MEQIKDRKRIKMKYNKKESSKKKIDLILLREKGMTKSKISKITGVPVELNDRQLKDQKQYKKYLGVFKKKHQEVYYEV